MTKGPNGAHVASYPNVYKLPQVAFTVHEAKYPNGPFLTSWDARMLVLVMGRSKVLILITI